MINSSAMERGKILIFPLAAFFEAVLVGLSWRRHVTLSGLKAISGWSEVGWTNVLPVSNADADKRSCFCFVLCHVIVLCYCAEAVHSRIFHFGSGRKALMSRLPWDLPGKVWYNAIQWWWAATVSSPVSQHRKIWLPADHKKQHGFDPTFYRFQLNFSLCRIQFSRDESTAGKKWFCSKVQYFSFLFFSGKKSESSSSFLPMLEMLWISAPLFLCLSLLITHCFVPRSHSYNAKHHKAMWN